jgi:hypothetical protein
MIKSHVLYQLSYRPQGKALIGEARAGVNDKLTIASVVIAAARAVDGGGLSQSGGMRST